jgi:hypothetical protein
VTTGAANLTITEIDASASAGTLTLDTSVIGAVATITTGSGTNSLSLDIDRADDATLVDSAGTDTINITGDASAVADVITNFEAGDDDIISIDLSEFGTAGVHDELDNALSSIYNVSIQQDADGAD